MKKLLILPILVITTLFSQNITEYCECDPCMCDPCECGPSNADCCDPCVFNPPCPPNSHGYNTPYVYDLCSCFDAYVKASFLYWEAYEDNLELGMTTTSNNADLPILNGVIIDMDYEYEPGFKIGMGFLFGCDNWDFNVEYTRYHPSITSSATRPGDGILMAYWMHPESTPFTSTLSGSSRWDLEMDFVDFFLRREYWVGKELTLRPFLGVRAAWMDQTYTANYTGLGTVPDDTARVIAKAKYHGAGFSTGLHSKWLLCGGFRVFGNFLSSIIYTSYDLSGSQSLIVSGVIDPNEGIAYTQDSKRSLRSNMEISIGLGWGNYVCGNKFFFDLALGYDFNVYWSQNAFKRFISNANDRLTMYTGDLYIHGLNITAKLHF